MEESAFQGHPPPADGTRPAVWDVVSPRPGEIWDCTGVGQQILGLPCHWLEGVDGGNVGSVYCAQEQGLCPHCTARARQIWQGFLAVYNHTLRRLIILRVGPESAKALAKRSIPHFGLRGVNFKVAKPKKGPTACLVFTDLDRRPSFALPPEVEIRPSVAMVLRTAFLPDYTYSAKELLEMGGVQ